MFPAGGPGQARGNEYQSLVQLYRALDGVWQQ